VGDTLLVFFNASDDDVDVTLPVTTGDWMLAVDTAQPDAAAAPAGDQVKLSARSVAIWRRPSAV